MEEKLKNEKKAVALGFFDGLHLGHIEVIKQALLREDQPSAVFTFSGKSLPPKLKSGESIISFDFKKQLLKNMGVSFIYAPDFEKIRNLSPEDFFKKIVLEELNAGFVSCGYDFRFGKGGRGDARLLKSLCEETGTKISVVAPFKVDGVTVSSTLIREFIRNGEIEKANKFLGYELTYENEVVTGKKIGKALLGFPTINQYFTDGLLIPKAGVYKSWTQIENKTFPSVTNIGVKPTIAVDKGEMRKPMLETHIINYSGNLYGERLKVILRSFIRPERKFKNLDELKNQIGKDKEKALII